MASVGQEKSAGGRRFYIQLSPSEDPKRPKIRLGRVSKRDAQTALVHVESLIRAKVTGTPVPPATAQWVANITESLRLRLEKLGLVERREAARYKLSKWIDNYIKGRTDVKSPTKRKWRDVEAKLLAFLPHQYIDELSKRDGLDFKVYLRGPCGLSENSARRHIGIARQFLKAAIDAGHLQKNPFRGQPVSVRPNEARSFFITPSMAADVLAACPDAEWRLIFGLCRFGGLRCPSEVLRLKWADVDFKGQQFKVHASKTEHHANSGVRTVPMFPELLPLFEGAFLETGGAEFCVMRYRCTEQNLRTTLMRIIKKANLDAWPKLFQNLRSSRETELLRLTRNVKAVCSWLGNSPEVALNHYAQVTDEDLREALKLRVLDMGGKPANAASKKAVQDPVQKVAEQSCTAFGSDDDESALEPVGAEPCSSTPSGASSKKWARRDSNPRPGGYEPPALTG